MVVRVTVYLRAIDGIFSPGGEIYEKTRRAARIGKADAQSRIHNRTGLLAASMYYRTYKQSPFECRLEIGNTAPYAKFVNDGTHTPIRPTHGQWLKLPTTHDYVPSNQLRKAEAYFAKHLDKEWYRPRPMMSSRKSGRYRPLPFGQQEWERIFYRQGFVLRRWVHGQHAQHFLEEGANAGCIAVGFPPMF